MSKITIEQLYSDNSKELLKLPESGMGYQMVENLPRMRNGHEALIIANAEISMDFEFEVLSDAPLLVNLDRFIEDKTQYFGGYFPKMKIKSKFFVATTAQIQSNIPSAVYPPYTYFTRPGDEFVRLSAFQNDKRIQSDGSVYAGTYATTPTDLQVLPSGLAAVARFALPSRLPACYLFKIIPPINTPVYFGTVTPNYGMCGGGVEVFFPTDLPQGSAQLYGTIPEK